MTKQPICKRAIDTVFETISALIKQTKIRVAQYLTEMPPKEVLEEKLALAIARAKKALDYK